MYKIYKHLLLVTMTHNNDKHNSRLNDFDDEYDESHYNEIDYGLEDPCIEDEINEYYHSNDFALCDLCKLSTICNDLVVHDKDKLICSECDYQLRAIEAYQQEQEQEQEAYQEKQFEDYLRLNSFEDEESDHPEFADCEACNKSTKWHELMSHKNQWFCGGCTYDALILNEYTEEQQSQLINYAEEYNISIEEAIEYQTHCHYCGNNVDDIFDHRQHQYCNKRCWESCEDYWYPCHKEGDCKVCSIWQYHKNREEKRKIEDEILKYNMVLFAIEAFKELEVYGPFLECIPDLIEYFA